MARGCFSLIFNSAPWPVLCQKGQRLTMEHLGLLLFNLHGSHVFHQLSFIVEWLTIRHIQGKLGVYFILLQNSAYEYCAQGFRAPRL